MAFLWLSAVIFSLLVHLQCASASFWTVTSNYQFEYSVFTYGISDDSSTTYTTTNTINPTVTPTAQPASRTTDVSTYYNVDYVSVYYPPNAVPSTDLLSTGLPLTSTKGYVYKMMVTYTAPTHCTSSFTAVESEYVVIPTDVEDQVTGFSTEDNGLATTVWLNQDQAPFTSSTAYYYTNFVQYCRKPSSSLGKPSGGGGGGRCGDGDCVDMYDLAIVLATTIPATFFLVGFLESWIWFRRLMLGKGCLRGGTICWVFISLLVLCFTRTQSSRSAEDQKLLREQWSKMGSGRAFKLWWKWGFRRKYPQELLGPYSKNTVGITPPNPNVLLLHPAYAAPGNVAYGPPPPAPAPAPSTPGNVMYGSPPPGPPVFWSTQPPSVSGTTIMYGIPPPGQSVYWSTQPPHPGQATSPPPMQQYGQPMQPPAPYDNAGGIGTAPSPQPYQQYPIPPSSEKDPSTVTETRGTPPPKQ
ncbi:hypothetical protein BU24DRAFT_136239 [Aaosphaeria arxii CBS 175.79]|uniref:Uncharacterized protein n=1 Tax=Aaosphaeria arxii CBS 175.79 TaxID=1450172 RepID=A0A6A5Y457_9PLEO|nr:uncharacterized protein BU24DRAFT_136239 [Aaosphaeria arxii CBS 175.79]KAF2020278.1 hypothetical protein BU24DRAFT_136239 [Aaosphaeria arxii CBS 175.79]